MSSSLLTLGIPALVILAVLVLMGWVVKRSWIDKKPFSAGSAAIGRQFMSDLSNDQQRKALIETVEQGERPAEQADEAADRDP